MPSRKVHNKVCEIFGINPKLADKVNRDIDYPSRYLGKDHRILFHDLDVDTMLLLAKYDFNPEAVLTWYLHKIVDEKVSKNQKLKELLEEAAASNNKNLMVMLLLKLFTESL